MRAIKLHDENHHVHVIGLSSCKACGSDAMLDATARAVTAGCQSCPEKVTERIRKTSSAFNLSMSAIARWNAKQSNQAEPAKPEVTK